MGTWTIYDIESAEEREVDVADFDGAFNAAMEWIATGDYGDTSCYVRVRITDPDGNDEDVDVLYECEPDPPECADGTTEHDWQKPEWLGGCQENPGVFERGGRLHGTEVCAKCGVYARWVGETLPGQYPSDPDHVRYDPPDAKSLKWVQELAAQQ